MTMKTPLLMAAIAAGITLAASAEARGEGGGRAAHMPTFEDLDLNADGNVTLEEIQAAGRARNAERFTEVDANGDGALSADEMLAHANEQRAERLADQIAERIEKADTNGDGLLQQSEIQAQAAERAEGRRGERGERMFERFDANEDGQLSAEEFAAGLEAAGERGERGRRGEPLMPPCGDRMKMDNCLTNVSDTEFLDRCRIVVCIFWRRPVGGVGVNPTLDAPCHGAGLSYVGQSGRSRRCGPRCNDASLENRTRLGCRPSTCDDMVVPGGVQPMHGSSAQTRARRCFGRDRRTRRRYTLGGFWDAEHGEVECVATGLDGFAGTAGAGRIVAPFGRNEQSTDCRDYGHKCPNRRKSDCTRQTRFDCKTVRPQGRIGVR